MVTFSFKDYGDNLGTRPLGQRVREQLLPPIERNDRVILDFTGVNVVNNLENLEKLWAMREWIPDPTKPIAPNNRGPSGTHQGRTQRSFRIRLHCV